LRLADVRIGIPKPHLEVRAESAAPPCAAVVGFGDAPGSGGVEAISRGPGRPKRRPVSLFASPADPWPTAEPARPSTPVLDRRVPRAWARADADSDHSPRATYFYQPCPSWGTLTCRSPLGRGPRQPGYYKRVFAYRSG
jgi:hypothetical protein